MNNVLIEEALRRAIAAEQSGDLDRAQKDLERSLKLTLTIRWRGTIWRCFGQRGESGCCT